MTTKRLPTSSKAGERLEDRYGHVAIRAVAGALKPTKPPGGSSQTGS